MGVRREYDMLFQLNAQLGGSYNSTFKSAQGELVKMQKEIDTLSRIQSDISAYQRQQDAVELTKKKLAALEQQYDNVQREMNETSKFSSDMANGQLDIQMQIDKTSSSLKQQTQKLDQMDTALQSAGVNTGALTQKSSQLGSQINDLKNKQLEAADAAQGFGETASQAFDAVGQAIVAVGATAALQKLYDAYYECADASMDFESAMTGVAKTTDLTDAEFAAMSKAIKEMSTEIPATTEELAAIAETAGQLGIQKGSLLDFTETMAMLGTATNMTSEEAATMLAQFASITGMDPANYSKLGSTIVDLGNGFATTERNIADMSQAIAAAGAISGMSEADIAAIAAAVTSLGISSQKGGTQMTKLISEINSAVSSGEGLSDWASAAQMSAADFAQAWGEDAAGALDLFIQGLNATYESGGDLYSVLSDLNINETEMRTTINSLAKSGTRLTDTLDVANSAWSENSALMTEAEKRYATTQSQLTMMQNAYNNLGVAVGDAYTPTLRVLYSVFGDVLDEMTEWVEQNPEMIQAFTIFTGVVGTATVALTGYAAITKVIKALDLVALFTGPAGAVLGVITGVAALTSGIVAMMSAANESVPSVKELTEASRGMSETMDAANDTYEETVSATLAAANVADTYIDKLEEMEVAGITTDEQARQYHNTLALLCQTVPALADSIDLENNAINGGTDGLRANTEAWKENAKAQAYQDYLTEAYKSYSAALIEAEKNSIGLTAAEQAQKAAEESLQTNTENMNKLWAGATERAAAYSKETGNSANVTDFLDQKFYDLQDSEKGLTEDIRTTTLAVDNYKKAIAEGGDATAEAKEDIALAEQAIDNLTGATEASGDAAGMNAEQQKNMQVAMGYVTEEAQKLADAYNQTYEAALASISGQFDLWEQVAIPVATSADTINSALASQISYWQDYNANLQALTDRGGDIAGLGDMIASFADGSSESVSAIAGMASASDADLAAMVLNWQELQQEQADTSGSMTDLVLDFGSKMDALETELATTVANMDLGTEAANSAKKTIQGFVNGANAMLPSVQAAYAKIAQAAEAALAFPSGGGAGGSVTVDASPHAEGGIFSDPHFGLVAEDGLEAIIPLSADKRDRGAALWKEAGLLMGMYDETADEAQLLSMAPQLMSYMASFDDAPSALSAEPRTDMGSGIKLTIAPVYQIDGVSNPAEIESILRAHDDDLREQVLEIIEEAGIDATRRSYQ